MLENGSYGKHSFELCEGCFSCRVPDQAFRLSMKQGQQGVSYGGKALDETLIEIGKTQKSLQVFDGLMAVGQSTTAVTLDWSMMTPSELIMYLRNERVC